MNTFGGGSYHTRMQAKSPVASYQTLSSNGEGVVFVSMIEKTLDFLYDFH